MYDRISAEDLMRYVDGELPPAERDRVDRALSTSTELQRELAAFRALKDGVRDLRFRDPAGALSVWGDIDRRVTRPLGWLLVTAGTTIWLAYGVYVFATSAVNPWEKIATGAIAIGVMTLLASVVGERYREWERDPYREVHR